LKISRDAPALGIAAKAALIVTEVTHLAGRRSRRVVELLGRNGRAELWPIEAAIASVAFTPSMMWTIWNAAIGSSSCLVRLGGRGIGFPSQSAASQLPITAQRPSVR
jgi:hypothetical protein